MAFSFVKTGQYALISAFAATNRLMGNRKWVKLAFRSERELIMQATLIDQGISLMLYGMGTVFVFLTILVFATTFMSWLVARFAPPVATTASTKSTLSDGQPSPQILQAIKQAIAEHRKR